MYLNPQKLWTLISKHQNWSELRHTDRKTIKKIEDICQSLKSKTSSEALLKNQNNAFNIYSHKREEKYKIWFRLLIYTIICFRDEWEKWIPIKALSLKMVVRNNAIKRRNLILLTNCFLKVKLKIIKMW